MAEAAITSQTLQPFCSILLGYTTPSVTATNTVILTTTVAQTVTSGTVTTITTVQSTTTATSTSIQFVKRSAIATPAALTTFTPDIITSACKAEASPVIQTSTVYVSVTSTATVTSSTTIPATTVTSTFSTLATATAVTTEVCPTGAATVMNGGFESGALSPFTFQAVSDSLGTSDTSYSVNNDPSNANSGNYYL